MVLMQEMGVELRDLPSPPISMKIIIIVEVLNGNRKTSGDMELDISEDRSRSRSREIKHGKQNKHEVFAAGEIDDGDTDKKFLFCCQKCKNSDKAGGKTCVCVVPRSQRRVKLCTEGCRTCGCRGCTKEDREYNQGTRKDSA